MTPITPAELAPLPEALGDRARRWLEGSEVHELAIGGERVPADDGRTFESLDPATGRAIARVALAGAQDVERAVQGARGALESGPWSSMSAAARSGALWALADALQDDAQVIAD